MSKNTPKINQTDPQAKIIIDWEEFEKLCVIQATEVEIAEWFGCTVQTLNEKCKEYYSLTFLEVFKKKSAKGKSSLRRAQFATALGIKEDGKFTINPNPTMQIWLGKQHLGQKDRSQFSNDPEQPFNLTALVRAGAECKTKEEFDKKYKNKGNKENE